MATAIEGTWSNGRVRLDRLPAAPNGTRVVVNFPDSRHTQPKQYIHFGMFRNGSGSESELDDFMEAKKIWREREFPG